VSSEVAQQVLNACPDAEWRLIFALSRFGGLRCPSEHLTLRWQDVNWEMNRMLIHAPKQEHHADGGDRWIPIFPELRPYLEESFDLAKEGAVHVITRYRDASNSNLRTQLLRIIKRAGLRSWPKLFHNLRASRETELAAEFPIHVVCEWIGNSARIAAAHYLQVTEGDFERASQGGAKCGAIEAQNPAQQPAAQNRKSSQESTEAEGECEDMREAAVMCATTQNDLVRPEGFEPPTLGSEDRCSVQLSYGRAAKSSAILSAQAGDGKQIGARHIIKDRAASAAAEPGSHYPMEELAMSLAAAAAPAQRRWALETRGAPAGLRRGLCGRRLPQLTPPSPSRPPNPAWHHSA
jgi:Phage integrase family